MDPRDREAEFGQPGTFDEKNMTLSYEIMSGEESYEETTLTFPAKYEVCGLCGGKGKHVNPSIDAHGISGEEFAEDPDFAEDYFSGRYDVTCYRCAGERVEPVLDESKFSAEDKKNQELLNEFLNEEYEYQRMCENERRYGA